jgi:hypothetical protein
MLPVTDLLLLTCLLSLLYAGLGVVSLAFERGSGLWLRRVRRGRSLTWQRVRRRAPRPRRRPGALAMPRLPSGAVSAGV